MYVDDAILEPMDCDVNQETRLIIITSYVSRFDNNHDLDIDMEQQRCLIVAHGTETWQNRSSCQHTIIYLFTLSFYLILWNANQFTLSSYLYSINVHVKRCEPL